LANLTSKVNQVVGDIRTNSISETNNLIYAAQEDGAKTCSSERKKAKDPWWKRRIKLSLTK